jgi:hypothetical protein
VPPVRTEAAFRQISLCFAGKEDRPGIAEDGVLKGPVKNLFEMLEGIRPVKPGIQCAMSKYPVRLLGAVRSGTNGKIRKCPDAVHHDSVEAMSIGVKPPPKSWRKSIPANEGRPESMYRARNLF